MASTTAHLPADECAVGSQFSIPDPTILIRSLNPYQMACFAIEGVFSTKILDDESILHNLHVRTNLGWPVWRGCICGCRLVSWTEALKSINPLHYFWLSQTGSFKPLFTASPGSDLAKWVAATVKPCYLPASFYEENNLDPATAFQFTPLEHPDPDYWQQKFGDSYLRSQEDSFLEAYEDDLSDVETLNSEMDEVESVTEVIPED